MMKTLSAAALLSALAPQVVANDNGLGLTPPRGWRSWNLYGNNVNQSLITGIMDGMVKKQTFGGGKPTSLCDLGYCDVGLDDHWQMCGSPDAAPGMHYHDKDGNPIVNKVVFPDLKAMADHAHSLKLTSGWYGNNCDCSDHCDKPGGVDSPECQKQIKGDVKALMDFGFDAWKLDGCGGETDMVAINKEIKAAGKAIMVENCHWGSKYPFKPDKTKPPEEGCPWNFYRSSGDVRASYASIQHNLATTVPLAMQNLSYPGCWAYPDMLQVGCAHGPGGASDPGLTLPETRTHFYAWVIVSSPLTLSHNVNDPVISERVWPIIANTEALAVSEAYFGHSGTMYKGSAEKVVLTDAAIDADPADDLVPVSVSAGQYFYKQMSHDGSITAVLAMNANTATTSMTVDFTEIPGVKGTKFTVRDINAHKDLGSFTGKWTGDVEGHDVAFLLLTAA